MDILKRFGEDAEYAALAGAVKTGSLPVLVNGLCEAARPAFCCALAEDTGKPAVIVVPDEKEAYRLQLRSSSDSAFAMYVISAEYVQNRSDTDIYVYYFNQNLPGHADPVRDEEFYGSFHSSELWYFFNSMRDVEGQRQWTEADYNLADQITSYIANFVKTGDPNGEGLAEWTVCSSENEGTYMWWANGESQCVTSVDEAREALNRTLTLNSWGLTEEDLL